MKEALTIKKVQLSLMAFAMAAVVALGMGVLAQPALADNAVPEGSTITVKDKQGVQWTFKNKDKSVDGMTIVKVKAPKSVKTIKVPTSLKVTYKGEVKNTYESFGIDANAFKGVKAKTIVITKSVTSVKKNAFKGSKATKLIIQNTKLTKKNVKKGWLSGSKVKTVNVVKSKAKAYKALLKKSYSKKSVKTKKVASKSYTNALTQELK